MRGSTAKLLRKVAASRYREMAATGQIAPPEDLPHMRHQMRVLYRGLKEVWKRSSRIDREKAVRRWKTSMPSLSRFEPDEQDLPQN